MDFLGRNKQQQAHEKYLFRENQMRWNKFRNFRRDILNIDTRQLHNTMENLIDYRDLFPVRPAECYFYEGDKYQ
ncbi:hypothetical protein [thiotrophic endosymbiont of Bathymodiolus puteoserpentis (Logatchev)]|uniref:hypothetical protein n=1 Tax=thiotrophic endosymbiont of Bathymodiolus puteoserpentis (Logatchev) TaxID=343240 RepID=UPI0010B3A06F|nr:hypothetical protein [thiotrophic endosymbiont of Bathymodiolus puteoserpentis (Logatchev)]SSC10500.1 hypothetical protein BPUTEOSOX_1967 [thiotrophic endosymbiont of Bathymodiolus puteoserpentis (Logatchev)]